MIKRIFTPLEKALPLRVFMKDRKNDFMKNALYFRRSFLTGFIFILLFFSCLKLQAEEFPFLAIVKADNINVRAGANINFESIYKLKKNQEIIVEGKSYEWYKIRLPKEVTGYISAQYVKKNNNSSVGLVTGDKVNLRAKPTEESYILRQVNKGQELKVIRKIKEWFEVELPLKSYGWVNENFVRYERAYVEPKIEEALAFKTDTLNFPIPTKEQVQEQKIPSIGGATMSQNQPSNTIEKVGLIQDLGRVIKLYDIHHKLVLKDKSIYYLKGNKALLDKYEHFTVKIIGQIQDEPSLKYPVILVSDIKIQE